MDVLFSLLFINISSNVCTFGLLNKVGYLIGDIIALPIIPFVKKEFMYKKTINNNRFSINSQLIFLFTAIAFAILAFFLWNVISIGLFTLITSVIFLMLYDKERWMFKYLTPLFIISLVVIISTYYGFIFQYGNPYIGGGSDDYQFEAVARLYIKNSWFVFTENHSFSTNDRFYVFLIELLIVWADSFDSYHTILPRIMNCFFMISAFVKVLWISRYKFHYDLDDLKSTARLFYCNIFFIYVSVTISRDIVGVFFALEIIYILESYSSRQFTGKVASFIGIFLLLFLSYYLRGQLLPIFIVMILMRLTFTGIKKTPKLVFPIFIVMVFIILLIVSQLDVYDAVVEYNTVYTDYQVDRGGLSGRIIGMSLLPFGAILRLGLGLIYPFPSFKSLSFSADSMIISTIFLLAYLYEMYVFVKLPKLFSCFKENIEYSVYYIYFLLQFCMLTFTFRHYIFAVPFYCILLGKKENRFQTKMSLFIMLFFYLVLQLVYLLM